MAACGARRTGHDGVGEVTGGIRQGRFTCRERNRRAIQRIALAVNQPEVAEECAPLHHCARHGVGQWPEGRDGRRDPTGLADSRPAR